MDSEELILLEKRKQEIKEYIRKLIELYVQNKISDEAYYKLKKQYETELEETERRILEKTKKSRETKNICPKCGAENPPDATFCYNCGAILRTNKEETPQFERIWLAVFGIILILAGLALVNSWWPGAGLYIIGFGILLLVGGILLIYSSQQKQQPPGAP
jgi:ribosomal protein L40E